MLPILFHAALGYLSGSILFARAAAALLHRQEQLQRSRDGNPGAANAFMHGGFLCGLLTLLGDLLKGFVPVQLYMHNAGTDAGLALVLAAPVLGHAFPLFYGFRGGKGIAVTFGVLLGLLPTPGPAAVLACFFLLFTLVIRITPNRQMTAVTYLCTLAGMAVLKLSPGVCAGFAVITAAVLLRLHLSPEEREPMHIRLPHIR